MKTKKKGCKFLNNYRMYTVQILFDCSRDLYGGNYVSDFFLSRS